MSHDATNWAIKQRGLKPALRVVLWHLCDRYNKDNGCFPSQDTLANDCEVPRSTLNVYLDELEGKGLIAREQRRQSGSNRQDRTRYRFPFEADFVAKNDEKPCPETGHGETAFESRNDAEPSPENGKSRVQNLDSNLVREPVREPLSAQAREGEGRSEKEDFDKIGSAAFEKRVQRFCNGTGFAEGEWKGWEGSTLNYIKGQFSKLSVDERREAEDARDAFLARCRRNGKDPMALGNFFRDRAWRTLSERDLAMAADEAMKKAGTKKPDGWVSSYSPQHSAAYLEIIARGPDRPERAPQTGIWFSGHLRDAWPRLFHFWQQSDLRGGLVVTSATASLADRLQFIPADSEMMGLWKAWFKANRLPDPKVMSSGAYLPAGAPEEAMREFVDAVARERGDDDAA